ncbi:hypothetical protein CPB84DRAFT_1751354 [Gymnopilus junonius]|uniref:Uncharacterized protein n=1 Tax=Gymnopilus junonius TaxID=109634 RepID=A0A9P5NET4_GYMJU|nr:hypothetical protein CPB84DRAFT_1751354 [Gymnopilus junonius]
MAETANQKKKPNLLEKDGLMKQQCWVIKHKDEVQEKNAHQMRERCNQQKVPQGVESTDEAINTKVAQGMSELKGSCCSHCEARMFTCVDKSIQTSDDLLGNAKLTKDEGIDATQSQEVNCHSNETGCAHCKGLIVSCGHCEYIL